MTITPHESLPGYYESSHGGWAFSAREDEDGSIETVETAIAAWVEWRDFLIQREREKGQEPLL